MKYKILDDLTSDVLFEAVGNDLKEVFENSALALSSIICNTKEIKNQQSISVEVTGKDEKDLLYNWLQEIIAQVDIESLFFSEFSIKEISKTHLKATLAGEPISKEKGETVVKAVTNYKFNLEKNQDGYKSTVSVDI